jgi:hypothetical protein
MARVHESSEVSACCRLVACSCLSGMCRYLLTTGVKSVKSIPDQCSASGSGDNLPYHECNDPRIGLDLSQFAGTVTPTLKSRSKLYVCKNDTTAVDQLWMQLALYDILPVLAPITSRRTAVIRNARLFHPPDQSSKSTLLF